MRREFTLERTTKNTYRYEEQVPAGELPICTVIYIQKSALPTKPQRIAVTIEEVITDA